MLVAYVDLCIQRILRNWIFSKFTTLQSELNTSGLETNGDLLKPSSRYQQWQYQSQIHKH